MKKILLFLLLLPFLQGNAQTETALLPLIRTHLNNQEYEFAAGKWRKAQPETPAESDSLFWAGIEIYTHFAEKEVDKVRRNRFIDTLVVLYQEQLQTNCTNRPLVAGHFGTMLLNYRPEKAKTAFEQLSYAADEMQTQTPPKMLITLLQTTNLLLQTSELSVGEATISSLKVYALCLEQTAVNDMRYAEVEKEFTRILPNSKMASCEHLGTIFRGRLNETPNDTLLWQEIISVMQLCECEQNPVLISAMEREYTRNPSRQLALKLGAIFKQQKNWSKAILFYEDAVMLLTDSTEIAETYLNLAGIAEAQKTFQEARNYAYQAIRYQPASGLPYLFIGDLYTKSFQKCIDEPIPQAVYWLAIDKYRLAATQDAGVRAEAQRKINVYSRYFPQSGDYPDVAEGDVIHVGCWINESTTARFQE